MTKPVFSSDLERDLWEPDVVRWMDIAQMLPAWFWQTDAEYRLTYVSDNLERFSSLKCVDLTGVSILNPDYGRDETEAGIGAYHAALRDRKPVENFAYEKLLLNGERAVFLDSALPLFDRTGGFLGYRGVTFYLSSALAMAGQSGSLISDLRTRAAALEAALSQRNKELEHSNKILSDILNTMGEGLLVTTGNEVYDDDNRILFVNEALRRQFGFSRTEVYPGRPFRSMTDILVERGDIERKGIRTLREALSGEGGTQFKVRSQGRVIQATGAERPGGGYVIVHNDVTDVQERAEMLERARRDADVANAAKTNFLASMSHEIRTPMNGIVGMTDLLAETGLDEEQRSFVNTIRSSALALTALISDILDFSKVEAGRIELSPSDYGLHDLVREVAALMAPLASAKALQLDLDIGADVPPFVHGDSARLRQVLVNLLGNAIKFTLSGRVSIRLTGAHPVEFEVSDTGIGIPSDKIDAIFKPFEQAQGGLQRQFEGTGLGLAITKNLVQAMQGDIRLESAEGEGTIFRVTLPLPVATAPCSRAPRNPVEAGIEGARVLVAEDNRTNQVVVERMLARLGAEIIVAEDGRAAIEAFEDQSFDIILMDLSMPRLSGLDATRLIRQIERDRHLAATPIVALTGNAFAQDRANAQEAGMSGFLSKPLQFRTLVEELSRHLGGGTASDQVA